MFSLLSYPNRGPWGRASWPGNCSGYVYKALFEFFRPTTFVDPMVGSGTSVEVARELGVKATGLDLHSGFNILRQSILDAIGAPADFVFSHPPYHNIIQYSGRVWGQAHPDDLSRCVSPDEFLEKLEIAVLNQRNATRSGGMFGCLIGDFWDNGRLVSAQAELVARLPAKELRCVIVKAQHNVSSDRKAYRRLRYPRLAHEYVVLWEKPQQIVSILQTLADVLQRDKARITSTWRAVVYAALLEVGGRSPLPELYEHIARQAPERLATNPNWKAKVRQTLQLSPDLFRPSERGVWGVAMAA